ncbi:hypothetical protein SAMN04488052_101330 [Aquisalimonas asiatica]|uniref:Uncharacterized protein n=1 Tax=Aquisalimonas asiatica TaxID=406100 RepID=A0A1H8Q446_9GAMM|nr:hypothetical protein SAMN04488052_101330 [Aquisalimonas asiatica]
MHWHFMLIVALFPFKQIRSTIHYGETRVFRRIFSSGIPDTASIPRPVKQIDRYGNFSL